MQCLHTIAPRPLHTQRINSKQKIQFKREQRTNTPNGCAYVTLNPKAKLDPPRLNPLSIFLNVQLNYLQESKNFVNLNLRKFS